MNKIDFQKFLTINVLLALVLLFLIMLTRASHELTSFNLPDASLAIFIAAGILLKQRKFLFLFVALIVSIDAYIININNMTHINFETSYMGHIFTYILTWELGRKFLSGNKALKAKLFLPVAFLAILVSYIISFSSHYFLSGWISSPNFYGGLSFLANNFNSFFLPNVVYFGILYTIFKIINKIPKFSAHFITSN
jgi:hypothetical protein